VRAALAATASVHLAHTSSDPHAPHARTTRARRQLANTEEFVDGQSTGQLGEVLIRCNNVLWLRGAPEEMEEGE
jgi:hypothetical protein